jgi:uncharacterized zinc-type alcohol dehydrogenase-like protein
MVGCKLANSGLCVGKEQEARDLGAHHFVNSKEEGAFDDLKESLDLILVTVSASLDWSKYLALLCPR